MVVGLLSIELYIPHAQSLKDKRMVLRSIKDRLKKGSEYRFGATFIEWLAAKGSGPEWGAKLHVSPRPQDLLKSVDLLLPYLRKRGVKHKVATALAEAELVTGEHGESQKGKFITIYPATPEQAAQLAFELDELLQKSGIGAGKRPPYDRPIGTSGAISYRYGKFRSSKKPIVLPDGREVADDREAVDQHKAWGLPGLEELGPFSRRGKP